MMMENSGDENKKLSDGQENSEDETNLFASCEGTYRQICVIIKNSSL